MDLLTALEDKRTHYTTFKAPINEGMDPDFIYIKVWKSMLFEFRAIW